MISHSKCMAQALAILAVSNLNKSNKNFSRDYSIKNQKLRKNGRMYLAQGRVILEDFDGGFYGSNEFRKPWHDFFENKLEKGETVYGEIVGYVNEQTPIMG